MGETTTEGDKYWGAQTRRSYENSKIGDEKILPSMICTSAHLRLACVKVNYEPGRMEERKLGAIATVCDEILYGRLDAHLPFSIWQTRSGTRSSTNINEVIANRGDEITKEQLLYPNDDVNKRQSSNDTLPTAMYIAAIEALRKQLMPQLKGMTHVLKRLEEESQHVTKIGHTRLQDATPLHFSQEISEWRDTLENNINMLQKAIDSLRKPATGGVAVGTGLNTPQGFSDLVCERLSDWLVIQFIGDPNKFHALSTKDGVCSARGILKALAANCMKVANSIRQLANGSRCGSQEIRVPENELGSSIIPGKVNPTQCEAMTAVAVQIIGNDTVISFVASQGDFELNVFMPVIVYNFLQSVTLLNDGLCSFHIHCVEGTRTNEEKMAGYLRHSLMLVTALNPHIGYENATKTAKKAYQDGISLKEACVALGFLSAEEFDAHTIAENMV